MALTKKQEAFIAKFLECDNATAAYKHAYDTENMKEATIVNSAYKLQQNGDVTAMIHMLKAKVNERVIEQLVIDRTFITNGVLDTIERTILDDDHSNTLKGYGMLNNMYDLNEDKQNDRMMTQRNKQAILENYRKRMLDVTPKE